MKSGYSGNTSTWHGFSPFYAGCTYGSHVCLGGEEKYQHCYGYSYGIGDLEWWRIDELEKLPQEEKDELLHLLERNKKFEKFKNSIAEKLAKVLGVEPYQVYRTPNKVLYEFVNFVHSQSNEARFGNNSATVKNIEDEKWEDYDEALFGSGSSS
jgi:hypothetical protein